MTRHTGARVPGGSESASMLDALLTVEREIAARLAQADADAASVVSEAYARVAAREAVMRATLQDELDAAERVQRDAAMRDEGVAAEQDARERRHLDSATDAELIALADVALALLLGVGGETGEDGAS